MDPAKKPDKETVDVPLQNEESGPSAGAAPVPNEHATSTKEEFVNIKQKVEALLDHLESFMTEPPQEQMMEAKTSEQEVGETYMKKPRLEEYVDEAENGGGSGSNY